MQLSQISIIEKILKLLITNIDFESWKLLYSSQLLRIKNLLIIKNNYSLELRKYNYKNIENIRGRGILLWKNFDYWDYNGRIYY